MANRKMNLKTKAQEELSELYLLQKQITCLKNKEKNLLEKVKKTAKENGGSFTTEVKVEGCYVNVAAFFDKRAANTVDSKALIQEVGLAGYAEVATVSQKAVKDNYGDIVLVKCLVEGKTEAFKVKEVKA